MSACTSSALLSNDPSDARSPFDAPTPDGYRDMLTPYRQPELRRSLRQLLTSLVPFFLIWALMWVSFQYSYALTLLLAVPAAGFLVRLFILQHDCGHGSFFKSKVANDALGRALSVLTLTPYGRWRKNHAVHHATSGDLDRRGRGDVHMLTVDEYRKLSTFKRLIYRVHRHPLVLFGIGPFVYFAIYQRFAYYEPRAWRKERSSVYLTNLALVVGLLVMSWLIGLKPFLLIHLPIMVVASSAGVWLFYVQHHFERAYWQRHGNWDYFDAGAEGSSYYALPTWLDWFTANIGLHHIHHLDSQIPNYHLRRCFNDNPTLQRVNRITLWQSLSCATLTLWDEEKAEMVGFSRK